MQENYGWAPCTIENAGFSSERRFEVALPSAGGKIVGLAYIDHFLDASRNPLSEGEPPYGQIARGFVRYRIMRREGDAFLIEFPGTEIFHVPRAALPECCERK